MSGAVRPVSTAVEAFDLFLPCRPRGFRRTPPGHRRVRHYLRQPRFPDSVKHEPCRLGAGLNAPLHRGGASWRHGRLVGRDRWRWPICEAERSSARSACSSSAPKNKNGSPCTSRAPLPAFDARLSFSELPHLRQQRPALHSTLSNHAVAASSVGYMSINCTRVIPWTLDDLPGALLSHFLFPPYTNNISLGGAKCQVFFIIPLIASRGRASRVKYYSLRLPPSFLAMNPPTPPCQGGFFNKAPLREGGVGGFTGGPGLGDKRECRTGTGASDRSRPVGQPR